MEVRILVFGQCRDIMNAGEVTLGVEKESTVSALRNHLMERWPGLKQLKSLMIAVNNEYAADDRVLSGNEEVALIPPVSGG